jgi:hypothetical protein
LLAGKNTLLNGCNGAQVYFQEGMTLDDVYALGAYCHYDSFTKAKRGNGVYVMGREDFQLTQGDLALYIPTWASDNKLKHLEFS